MPSKKISELPDFKGKELMQEAMNIGEEAISNYFSPLTLTIAGLCNVITEMQEEIEELKSKLTEDDGK